MLNAALYQPIQWVSNVIFDSNGHIFEYAMTGNDGMNVLREKTK